MIIDNTNSVKRYVQKIIKQLYDIKCYLNN